MLRHTLEKPLLGELKAPKKNYVHHIKVFLLYIGEILTLQFCVSKPTSSVPASQWVVSLKDKKIIPALATSVKNKKVRQC
jgi:hypothetical protein